MDGNMAGEVFFDIAVDAVVTQPTMVPLRMV